MKDAERLQRTAACKLPKMKSFTVKQIEDEVNHDVCVQLSWKARPSNFNRWCSSEGWKIFVSSWDTVANIPEEDFADEDSSTVTFNWSELVTVPLANHSVTICHLRNDTYYEFKLNATFQKKSQIKPIKALSHLYYFGQQGQWSGVSMTGMPGSVMEWLLLLILVPLHIGISLMWLSVQFNTLSFTRCTFLYTFSLSLSLSLSLSVCVCVCVCVCGVYVCVCIRACMRACVDNACTGQPECPCLNHNGIC